MRYVKKIAPYTEFTDIQISTREENYAENIGYIFNSLDCMRTWKLMKGTNGLFKKNHT